jgi:hypothetical protein
MVEARGMTRWLTLVSSLAAFVAAAKTHGRQVRLERELAGYHEVHFGGSNPPFVEALWRRESVAFWSVSLVLAVAWLVFGTLSGRFKGWSLWVPALLWAPTLAFVATGLWSAARLGLARASMGSLVWWSLTAGLIAAAVATRAR